MSHDWRQTLDEIRAREQKDTNDLKDNDIVGPTWTTTRLLEDFEVEGFLAPYVVVTRRVDGVKGTLTFRHYPRIYFDWQPDRNQG